VTRSEDQWIGSRQREEKGTMKETHLSPNSTIAIDTLRDTDSPASRIDPCSMGSERKEEKGRGNLVFPIFLPADSAEPLDDPSPSLSPSLLFSIPLY